MKTWARVRVADLIENDLPLPLLFISLLSHQIFDVSPEKSPLAPAGLEVKYQRDWLTVVPVACKAA